MSTTVHLLAPSGVSDSGRPSGGNVYDLRLADALRAAGRPVVLHEVASGRLGEVLAKVPDGATAVVDGLVGSPDPDALAAHRDRVVSVLLMHLPLGVPVPGQLPRSAEERRSVLLAAAVVCTSRWTRDWLATAYGVPDGRLHVAAPGVEPASLSPGTDTGGRLLSVGAITPVKGHDVLVDALARLADLDWTWTLVGAALDPDHAGAVWSALCRAGLDGRVRLAGVLTGTGLADAYAEADLLVLPSRHETFGMVATEALARGLPVVATDVGGVREALSGGRGGRVGPGGLDGASPGRLPGTLPGMLVGPEDPDALAAALRLWLASPERRASLRAAAACRRTRLSGWAETARVVGAVLDGLRVHPAAGP